ncbi:LppU/SCO3897 family protein [Beutenbergia cavernae]|nr:hypothetical protein [Beutenbergia cavernae]
MQAWFRIVSVMALAVAAFATAGCGPGGTPFDEAEAGDCLGDTGDTDTDDLRVTDCAEADARWTVLGQVEGAGADACADLPDTDVIISAADDSTSTCVRFRAAEGDCVWTDLSGYANCEEDSGYQLAAIVEAAADDTGCPEDTAQSRIYSDGVVYCWVQHSV